MQEGPLPRPTPLPASPHLRPSHVLKMVNEEGHEIKHQEWPPKGPIGAPRPHEFLTKCAIQGGRKIAWPPHLDYEGINDEYLAQQDPEYQGRIHNDIGPDQKQNATGPNLTTTYPSGFKLKDELEMSHQGPQVVPSQPAFKISKPMKMRGDDKWPPRKGTEDMTQEEEVREFLRPKKANRDYSEFFAQNALPNNYPAYRAPPGTQHHAPEDETE